MIMKKDVTKKIIASSCSITGKENKNAKKKNAENILVKNEFCPTKHP